MKIVLKIEGMTCASCTRTIESALIKLEGVKEASVNIATHKAQIEFDREKLKVEDLTQAIESAGYKAVIEDKKNHHGHHHDHHHDHHQNSNKIFNRFLGSLIFSVPVLLISFFKLEIGLDWLSIDLLEWVSAIFTVLVVLYFGFHFHLGAIKKLKHLAFNMDSLVSMGTMTALIYSLWAMLAGELIYFEAAAAIITLINLGKYLEARSMGQAGQALQKLLELGLSLIHI